MADVKDYRYNIYINNSSAINNISKLESETVKLERSLEKMRQEGKQDTQEFKNLESQIIQNEMKMKTLRNGIDINTLSLKSLRAYLKTLNNELSMENPGTRRFKELQMSINAANARLKELKGTSQSSGSVMSNMANGFNKYFGMATAAVASITGLSFAFRKLAEDVAKMDDVYSDVMKTTGLTRDKVLDLNESFKQMDTRTSREDLNKLAEEAGKLGIEGKENILDFVDAGNQIKVALGEDLGEDAIKNIGKMVGVFEKSTQELQGIGLKEQMLAVGSAVNELGASSSASEEYLVQFAGRLGGVATQAGIGMDSILGFASALDQDMQQVEMSATALQQFIMKVMGEPAKFAKLAGLNVKEFSNLLNTDANAAIKQVLKALNEKGGFQALIPVFQEMRLDGARATGVLSSMANSIDKIDEAQKVANQAMMEGTSITKEYETKNDNLAAKLDKAKKAFKEQALELGESLNPMLLQSTNGFTYLIKVLVELPKWLKENKGLIITLSSVMAVYTIAVNANRIAVGYKMAMDKLDLILTRSKTVATYAAAAAQALFTGNITRAKAAMKLLNAEMLINPYVAIGVAIAAITVGVYKLITANNKLTASQKSFINIQQKTTEEYDNQASTVDKLVGILNNEHISLTARREALLALKKIIPGYHADLTSEGKLINDNKTAIDEYLKSLENEIRLKAVSEELEQQYRNKRNAQNKLQEKIDILNKANQRSNANKPLITFQQALKLDPNQKEAKEYLESLKAIQDLEKEYGKTSSNVVSPLTPQQENENNTITGLSDEEKKKQQEDALKALEKANQDVITQLKQRRLTEVEVERQFDDMLLAQKLAYLKMKLALEQKFAMDTNATQQDLYDTEYQFNKRAEELRQITDVQDALNRKKKLTEIKINESKANTIAENVTKFANNESEKQSKKREDAYNAELERQANINQLYGDSIADFGGMLGEFMADQEMSSKEFMKNMILLALNVLEKQVMINIAAAQAGALATPESIATWGAAGTMKAAVLSGLIMAAFEAVKGIISAGMEQGGMAFVTREQDGKVFNANVNPTQRGFINKPTLLVGENGMEQVIPNEGLMNPNIRPILNAIEVARQKGKLKSLRMEDVLYSKPVQAREMGGYAFKKSSSSGSKSIQMSNNNELLIEAVNKLSNKLDQPLTVFTKGKRSISEEADLISKMEKNKSRNL